MATTVATMQVREGGTYLPVGLVEEVGGTIAPEDRISVARMADGPRQGGWIAFTPNGRYKAAESPSGYALPSTFFLFMFGDDTPYRLEWTGETYKHVYDGEVVTYYKLTRID